jgi:hypothetical protein
MVGWVGVDWGRQGARATPEGCDLRLVTALGVAAPAAVACPRGVHVEPGAHWAVAFTDKSDLVAAEQIERVTSDRREQLRHGAGTAHGTIASKRQLDRRPSSRGVDGAVGGQCLDDVFEEHGDLLDRACARRGAVAAGFGALGDVVDLLGDRGDDEVGLGREVAVERADCEPSGGGDLVRPAGVPDGRERRGGSVEAGCGEALRRPRPGRCAPRAARR